jgi:hypothetical protein
MKQGNDSKSVESGTNRLPGIFEEFSKLQNRTNWLARFVVPLRQTDSCARHMAI